MANPAKLGTEFQVNSFVPDGQKNASVTGLTDGGFVVTWESYNQDAGITDNGVYGQRYNGDGTRAGTEFQINSVTADDQGNVAVTGLTGGGFVVTWQSFGQDGSYTSVHGQRYNGDGSPAGTEFQINSHTLSYQDDVAVAGLADGGFIVTWESLNQDDPGNVNDGIYGQRYNGDGSPAGTEFQINTHTLSYQDNVAVASLADGGFIVTWESLNQDAPGQFDDGIYGQRYNGDGTRAGTEFHISTETESYQQIVAVTGLVGGGFVVTWQSYNQDAGVNDNGVYGQRYNSDGTRTGTEFQINTQTTGSQEESDVTALADGGFVVTWQARNQVNGADTDGIYGQRYNADGTRNGTEFLINTRTAENQNLPSVSVLANGNIIVVWESYNQDAGGNDEGVFAQMFSVDLFTAGDDMVYLPAIGPSGGWQALGGDDYVIGGDAADSVDGGDGSDWLYGGSGDDTINAGAGAMDVSLGDDGNDTINGEGGMDYMYGYAGNDTLRGGAGDDVAYGGAGNDELYGDDGADWLFGEAGNDKLFGGAGADLLMGGAGVDEITGGAGNDWLWGGDMTGAGDGVADTFIFGSSWGGDVIWDFENGTDRLDVSGAGITSFADLTIGTFGQFTTITAASGDIIYLRGAGDVAIAESSVDAADFIFA